MPASAKRLVEELTFTQLEEQIGALQTEKELLREQLKRTSATIPTPSQDLRKDSPSRPNKSGKKRGDKQDMRDMDVSFIRLKSATASRTITQMCWNCGESLEGEEPYRHQIVEIPPVVGR